MTALDESDDNHAYGTFIKDSHTSEMVHYREGHKRSNLPVNCGVYLLSSHLLHDKEFLRTLHSSTHTSVSYLMHEKRTDNDPKNIMHIESNLLKKQESEAATTKKNLSQLYVSFVSLTLS